MNLQQLRYVREAVRQGLNLTEAANALFTSQPGVSRQIRDLEEELGVEIFVRRGKRIVSLTPPGKLVVAAIDRLLIEAENLRRIGQEFHDDESGGLTVATTHTQARYALPPVIQAFKRQYPNVRLSLYQGNPKEIARMVMRGEADVAIATEALDRFPELLTLPAYTWHHLAVVPNGHPLIERDPLTLEDLARFPLITYSPAFTGRTRIDDAFAAEGLPMDVILTAIDADVIKTYVELGLGVGIIAAMAYDSSRDRDLHAIDAGHLFHDNVTKVGLKRGAYLRGYIYAFIELFAPQLTREAVERAGAHVESAAEPTTA